MIYQILALFIWSSSFVAAKYTFTMMDTILMIQARLLMAAIIVIPLFFRRWKGVSKPMRKQLWWLGFFNYTATFLLGFIGLKYTSAASATTMIGLEPLCVIFIGHFFFQDRAKWYHWLCGAFAFLGVAILILGGFIGLLLSGGGKYCVCLLLALDEKSGGNGFSTSLYIHFDCVSKHHHAAIYFIADGKLGYPF